MKRIKTSAKAEKAKVKVDGSTTRITFVESEKVLNLKTKDQPDFVKSGTFSVRLNKDGDEIQDMHPWSGVVTAKFSHFVSKKDEKPAPQQKEGQYGAYLFCIAICNLLGEYKGMTVPSFLIYKFADDGDGNAALTAGGKSGELFEAFLEATGAMDTDIPFSENILPALQKKILKLGKTFKIGIKDGFADSFYGAESDDDDEDDDDDSGLVVETLDDDEEVKPKKKAAKVRFAEDDEDDEEDDD